MRHGFKKIRFRHGQDADRMLVRKLVTGFFLEGKVTTTISKIKAIRPLVEHAVTKIKTMSQADTNYLRRNLGDIKALETRFKDISSAFSKVQSGYTRIVKIGSRDSDGATTARLEWAYPVIMNEKKAAVKKVEAPKAKEVKTK